MYLRYENYIALYLQQNIKTGCSHMEVVSMGFTRLHWGLVATLFVLAACQQHSGSAGTVSDSRQRAMSSSSPGVSAPSANQQSSPLAAGEMIYNKSCKACHGARGNGFGSMRGPSLRRKEYRYGRDLGSIVTSIRDGRPKGMPAFGKVLTPDTIDAVARYVVSVQK